MIDPIGYMWALRDAGELSTNDVHQELGNYFGYPACCIKAFIRDYPEANNGGIARCPDLGTYYHCEVCYENRV